MPKTPPPEPTPRDRYEDSPIAWFGELLIALDRRDIDRAAESKAELARLGWTFRFRKPRPDAPRQGGDR